MTSSTTDPLYGVWGISPTDVFVVGGLWDGTSYHATMLHYDGSAWGTTTRLTAGGLSDVWGSSASDVFAVGDGGVILHYDGSVWTEMPGGSSVSLRGVWGTSSSDVYAVGGGDSQILHYNGSSWSVMNNSASWLNGVWGSSSSDIFAVGVAGSILHYNGSAWSAMSSNVGTVFLHGVWGSSSSDVFAVGEGGTVLHYNGSAWSAMSSGTTNPLHGVWGSSSSDVFAVGWNGTILHYNGGAWSAMSSGTTNVIRAVWGSSANDVFAIGTSGTILHYNGSIWSGMSSGTSNALSGVWGSSATDVFAVGTSGAILHYNGSIWSSVTKGSSLYGVWGSSPTDVFAVGHGTILHYNGTTWTSMDSGTTNDLYAVWGSSATDVFTVGMAGSILHYSGPLPNVGSVSPSSSVQGQILSSVVITGTNFTRTTAVSFGSGITVNSFTVDSATQITASITVSGSASIGVRDVSVTTPTGIGILTGMFSVAYDGTPRQPLNVSPPNGATTATLTPTLQSSAFSDPDAGDTHVASQWQITTIADNYSSPVFDSGTDASNLTSITVPSEKLDYSIPYYWHVRHQDHHGVWSDWSAETSFTVLRPPNQPSNIVPPTAATGVSLTPTLQSSPFSDPDSGKLHLASQWQVRKTSGSYTSPIYDSGTDNTNLTIITIPSGLLSHSTAYCWHVRYQDSTGLWSDWSAETFFTTTAKGGLPFWIWIVVGVGAFLIAGAGAFLVGRTRGAQQQTAQTTTGESRVEQAQKESASVPDSANTQSKSIPRKGAQWKTVVGWVLFAWGLVGLLANIVFILVWGFTPLSVAVNSAVCVLFLLAGWRLSHPTTS
jgi:hypothetical protein